MKKLFIQLFILLLIINSLFITNEALGDTLDLYKYEPYNSKIELNKDTGGNCSHLSDEFFYQYYGIKLNLTNNKSSTWLGLKNKVFYNINNEKMIIRTSEVKRENALMWVKGNNEDHICWVYKINSIALLTVEGNTTEIKDYTKIKYGDSWYYNNFYTLDYIKNKTTVYIYAEKVIE